jgi:hypothetical protein
MISLPLLSRHNIPPTPIPRDLPTQVWFMTKFALCFTIGKLHGWGTFPKYGAGLSYHLLLGPLFWECPHILGLLPYTNKNLPGSQVYPPQKVHTIRHSPHSSSKLHLNQSKLSIVSARKQEDWVHRYCQKLPEFKSEVGCMAATSCSKQRYHLYYCHQYSGGCCSCHTLCALRLPWCALIVNDRMQVIKTGESVCYVAIYLSAWSWHSMRS